MSSALELFWNSLENRPRAMVRILFFFAGYALLYFAIQFAITSVDEMTYRLVYPLSIILSIFMAMWLAGRFLDRRPLADFGLRLNARWWLDFGFGLLLGGVLMAMIFGVEYAAGWVEITETFKHTPALPFLPAILLGLWHFVEVGIQEELITRGYLMRNVAEGLNWKVVGPRRALLLAYLISSAIFGVLHFFNPNASWVSTILLVAAGIMLGLGYYLTGSLAIPIGLHISWNFFQGRVFGFPVSGGKAGSTFIAIQQGGPELWTGGAFGPEAGLLGLIAIIIGCALTVWWVKWRYGHVGLADRLAVYESTTTLADTIEAEKDQAALSRQSV